MKIWSSEHIFNHCWENVVKAAINKYPNPLNPGVIGVDVIDRHVDIDRQCIRSHRLFATRWNTPGWISKLIGGNPVCYASEHSHIDLKNKELSLLSRNLNLKNVLHIEERLTYSVHPEDSSKTLLRQEAQITVQNVPLINNLENLIATTINSNANKGRQAIEYIITKMNDIKEEATHSVVSSIANHHHHNQTSKVDSL